MQTDLFVRDKCGPWWSGKVAWFGKYLHFTEGSPPAPRGAARFCQSVLFQESFYLLFGGPKREYGGIDILLLEMAIVEQA